MRLMISKDVQAGLCLTSSKVVIRECRSSGAGFPQGTPNFLSCPFDLRNSKTPIHQTLAGKLMSMAGPRDVGSRHGLDTKGRNGKKTQNGQSTLWKES